MGHGPLPYKLDRIYSAEDKTIGGPTTHSARALPKSVLPDREEFSQEPWVKLKMGMKIWSAWKEQSKQMQSLHPMPKASGNRLGNTLVQLAWAD